MQFLARAIGKVKGYGATFHSSEKQSETQIYIEISSNPLYKKLACNCRWQVKLDQNKNGPQ